MGLDKNKLDYRLIRIGDASRLRKAGLMCGTISEIEQEIRSFSTYHMSDVLVVSCDIEPICMIKLFCRDRKRCNLMLELVFGNSYDFDDPDLTYAIIDSTIYRCFISNGFHKVSITLFDKNLFLENVITSLGFVQEAILRDEVQVNGRFLDAGLFSLLAPNYDGQNVCFVPFQRGLVAVFGNRKAITGMTFYHYGDKVEDEFSRAVADYKGFLDDSGCFLPRGSEEYKTNLEVEDSNLPKELAKAFDQLREYFMKRREQFDINIDFGEYTDFQKQVWDEVTKIPYGATRSYEDIALKISKNDKSMAHKLSRAVGSACSDNPIPIIVPCHRVIGKDGKLIGYSGGVEFKDFLLQLEAFSATIL